LVAANNIVNLIPSIVPGIVYLTIGTAQQVKFICELLGVSLVEVLFEPTTLQIRRAVGSRCTEEPIAVVIHPSELSGTGEVNLKARSKNYGSVKTTLASNLPNDMTFSIDPNIYVFICLLELTDAKPSSAIKSLEGGVYRELDLRKVEFIDLMADQPGLVNQFYPYTSLYRINYKLLTGQLAPEDSLYKNDQCFQYIKALLEPTGHKIWSSISSADYNGLFRPTKRWSETVEYPIVLVVARAYALYPYLKPVLDKVRDTSSPQSMLGLFALWVNLSSTLWQTEKYAGLTYEPARGKRNGYWKFRPSPEAKTAYSKLIDRPLLTMPLS
jgi:hypothetical protein